MVKKTGDVVKDRLHIDRENDTFIIHFPNLIGNNPSSIGVNVTLNLQQLEELHTHVHRMLAWTCPKCGNPVISHRRSELDWDIKVCEYCGWEE